MQKHCKKCGFIVDNDAKFCAKCGHIIENSPDPQSNINQYTQQPVAASPPQQQYPIQPSQDMYQNQQNSSTKKTSNSKIIIVAAIVIICILSSIFVIYTLLNSPEDKADSFPTNGLVAYWSFDEGSGEKINDASSNGFDGSIYDASWVNGVSGYALSFDGFDDYALVPDDEKLRSENITLLFWLYPTWEDSDSKWIIGKGCKDRWGNQDACSYGINFFDYDEDGTKEICVILENNDNDQTIIPYTITSLNRWYHVALTFNDLNQEAKLYVNGIFRGEADHGQSLRYYSSWDLLIGGSHSGTGSGVNSWVSCKVDEVFVYNRVLNENEITYFYNNP